MLTFWISESNFKKIEFCKPSLNSGSHSKNSPGLKLTTVKKNILFKVGLCCFKLKGIFFHPVELFLREHDSCDVSKAEGTTYPKFCDSKLEYIHGTKNFLETVKTSLTCSSESRVSRNGLKNWILAHF